MTVANIESIKHERLRLVERLRQMSPDDWAAPSLCAGWTVKEVVAHLITPFVVPVPSMMLKALRYKGMAGAMNAIAHEMSAHYGPEDLISILEENADNPFRPPLASLAAPLTDIIAHSADIRWVIGDPIADWEEPGRIAPVLDFLMSKQAKRLLVSQPKLSQLRFVASDLEWEHGDGAIVRGPSLILTMAVLKRRVAKSGLEGDGVELLSFH